MRARANWRTGLLLACWLTGVFAVQLFVNISGKGGITAMLLQVGAVAWPLPLLPLAGYGILPSNMDRLVLASLGLFILIALNSCLISPVPLLSVGYLGATLLGIYVAMLFNSRFRREDFLLGLKIFAVICGILLIAYISFDYREGYRLGFGTGTMNPNSLGMVSMACVVAALAYQNLMIRIVLIISAMYAIYLTDSRTSALAMLIALTVALWDDFLRMGLIKKVFVIFLLSISGIVIMVAYWSDIYDFLHGFFQWDDPERGIGSGATGRTKIWGWMLDLIRDHLVLGVGYRAHQQFIPASSAHNGYLAMLAEVGLFGFMAIMVLLFYRGWKLFRCYIRSSDQLLAIYFGFFLGFLGLAMFERFLLNVGNPASLLFLLVLFLPQDFCRTTCQDPGDSSRS